MGETILSRQFITIWSILALIAAAAGTGATLLTARILLGQWSASGEQLPITDWGRLTVPEDGLTSLVYYESEERAGSRYIRLYIRDVNEEQWNFEHVVGPGHDVNDFSIGGRHGRAFCRLNLEQPGEYMIRCVNGNYESDDEIPAADRVVFFKTPNTRAEVLDIRRWILTIGGSVTVAATLILYGVHYVILAHRRRDQELGEPLSQPTAG